MKTHREIIIETINSKLKVVKIYDIVFSNTKNTKFIEKIKMILQQIENLKIKYPEFLI